MYITITRRTIPEFVPPATYTPTTWTVKKINSMEDIIAVTCAFTRTRFMFKALLDSDMCSAAIGLECGRGWHLYAWVGPKYVCKLALCNSTDDSSFGKDSINTSISLAVRAIN